MTSILREVRHHFGFLLDEGYQVQGVDDRRPAMSYWAVTLRRDGYAHTIQICEDRLAILIYFVASDSYYKERFSLAPVIFCVTHGSTIVQPYRGNLFWGRQAQYKESAALLRQYLDPIVSYFEALAEEQRVKLTDGRLVELKAALLKWQSLVVDSRLARK